MVYMKPCLDFCHVSRFNATRLLEKLRNKRLVFVGDSLNRNQWVSLVCMVEASIPDNRLKMRVFNGSLISFKAFVCFSLHKSTSYYKIRQYEKPLFIYYFRNTM